MSVVRSVRANRIDCPGFPGTLPGCLHDRPAICVLTGWRVLLEELAEAGLRCIGVAPARYAERPTAPCGYQGGRRRCAGREMPMWAGGHETRGPAVHGRGENWVGPAIMRHGTPAAAGASTVPAR